MTARIYVTTAAAILIAAAPLASAQSKESADSLERWVTAVRTHVPGQADRAAGAVASLSYAARSELHPAMRMFLEHLRGRRFAAKGDGAKKVIELARGVEDDHGIEAFLKRAAVLHTDAAVFADRFPVPPDDAPPRPPERVRSGGRRPDPPPPLLWNERAVLTRDGQVLGETSIAWHLVFARSLIDPRPFGLLAEDDDFIGEWYHAVAAYFFAIANNADAAGHLRRAAELLPNDARLLFDRASYAETLGLPIYQAVLDEPDSRNGVQAELPPEEKTNAEAERLYRRALDVDPALVEAHVRLARLLDHRGRHEEAAHEIATALDAKPAGVVALYAHIVAGRIAMARGRYDEALLHYREAA